MFSISPRTAYLLANERTLHNISSYELISCVRFLIRMDAFHKFVLCMQTQSMHPVKQLIVRTTKDESS
jgi:hypothetical protein